MMFLIYQSSKNILDYQKQICSRYVIFFFRNLIVKLILDLSQFNIINLNDSCSNIITKYPCKILFNSNIVILLILIIIYVSKSVVYN